MDGISDGIIVLLRYGVIVLLINGVAALLRYGTAAQVEKILVKVAGMLDTIV